MILSRYLIVQSVPPFLFGLSLFSGVLLLDKIFGLVDLLVNKGVSLAVSAKILALFFPTVLSLSVPMALLLACLLAFGRLSEDNEILALRASGLSLRKIFWPPLAFGLFLSALLVPFNTTFTPRAMEEFRTLFHKIATTDPLIQIEPKHFLSVQNMRLYATSVSKDKERLENVWIYRLFPDRIERVFARQGTAHVDYRQLSLTLENGQMEKLIFDRPDNVVHVSFKEYKLGVPFQQEVKERGKAWREYTTSALRSEIKKRRQLSIETAALETEFHLRYAMAFAPLALGLIGLPLAVTMKRGGGGAGFGAAVGVLFFYYLLLIMGINLAEREALPPMLSVWLANLVATGTGLLLYWKKR